MIPKRWILRWLLAALLPVRLLCAGGPAPPIAGHAALLLNREFTQTSVSYLLMDAGSGEVLASRWHNADREIPIGSLAKPFTALAYAQTHSFTFPEHACRDGCWMPGGHGTLGIVKAVAQSCNSYFTALGREIRTADAIVTAHQFGLQGPGANVNAEGLAGKLGAWRESPLVLARAYAEILRRRTQPGAREIVEGMLLSAKSGTAQGIGKWGTGISVLAKTGTAPCTHSPRAPGDGLVVAAWPAESPRYVLLLRQHSVPGSHAASLAGRMIQLLESQP